MATKAPPPGKKKDIIEEIIIKKEDIEFYNDYGYAIIRGAINEDDLEKLEEAIRYYHAMQALKIEPVQLQIQKGYSDCNSNEDLIKILELLEQHSIPTQNEIVKGLPLLRAVQEFQNLKIFSRIYKEIYQTNALIQMNESFQFFINRPKTQRLLRPWHNGEHSYPKRKNYIQFWSPLFSGKNKKNGTLRIANASHKLPYLPFTQIRGFSNSDSKEEFVIPQMKIPKKSFESCPITYIKAERGDIVFFAPRTVHSSSRNESSKYSFACGFKVWDASRDFTISSKIQEQPYTGVNYIPGDHNLLLPQ